MKPQGYIPAEASPSAREGADIHIRNVVAMAIALALTVFSSVLILTLFFRYLENGYPRRTSEAAPLVQGNELPPAPRLQTHPLLDLQAFRAAEDAHLNKYVWIDRNRGIAQIPIDRAMVLWSRQYSSKTVTPTGTSTGRITDEIEMRRQKGEEAKHAP
jgi:hypothetical protein